MPASAVRNLLVRDDAAELTSIFDASRCQQAKNVPVIESISAFELLVEAVLCSSFQCVQFLLTFDYKSNFRMKVDSSAHARSLSGEPKFMIKLLKSDLRMMNMVLSGNLTAPDINLITLPLGIAIKKKSLEIIHLICSKCPQYAMKVLSLPVSELVQQRTDSFNLDNNKQSHSAAEFEVDNQSKTENHTIKALDETEVVDDEDDEDDNNNDTSISLLFSLVHSDDAIILTTALCAIDDALMASTKKSLSSKDTSTHPMFT